MNGFIYPAYSIAFGEVTEAYDPKNKGKVDQIMLDIFKVIGIAAVYMWLTGYAYYALFQQLSEQIATNLRSEYLRALLK